jgi:hypothetical protein
MRKPVLIDPNAPDPPSRKERNIEAERRKRELEKFHAIHPLAEMYKAVNYAIWAREECAWAMAATYLDYACSAYANMTDEDKSRFADVLPRPPDVRGRKSSWAWISYLTALLEHPSRRDALKERVRQVIIDTRDAEHIPFILKEWTEINVVESPF